MEPISIIYLFIILMLSVVLVSILLYYVRLQKRFKQQEKELNKHYLQRARTEANEIVEEAGQEALSMLNASRVVSEKDQVVLEAVVKQLVEDQSVYLKTSTQQLMQEFNTQLQQIRNNNIQALAKVSEEINTASVAQADEYSKALDQVKVTTNKLVQDLNGQLEQVKQGNLQALDEMSKSIANASGTQNAQYNKVLEEIKTINEGMVTEFKTQLQQLKNYNINMLTNISKDIESTTKTQVGEYVKTIEEETIGSEKQVSKTINDEYKLVQNDIAAYKAEQLKKIDANLQGLIKKLTTEILEKSISPSEHKDIIMQTLEKAKNENIFVN